jgi:hypothetical protein
MQVGRALSPSVVVTVEVFINHILFSEALDVDDHDGNNRQQQDHGNRWSAVAIAEHSLYIRRATTSVS